MAKDAVTGANRLIFGVLAAIVALSGGLAWERSTATNSARAWAEHTHDVLDKLKDLQIGLRDAETGQRGYLLSDDESYLAPYIGALRRVAFIEGELQRLTADNPIEQDRLRTLSPIVQSKLEELAQTIQLRRTVGLDPALALLRTNLGRDLQGRIDAILTAMVAEEEGLLSRRLAAGDERGAMVRWLLLGTAAVVLAALLLAVRMLNGAWSEAVRLGTAQRALATRLRTSLDSLSQGVGVFDAGRLLVHWNECFGVLLSLPDTTLQAGSPYARIATHAEIAGGGPVLETEDQIEHGRSEPGVPITYERSRAGGHLLELRRTPMPRGGFVLTVTDMTKRAQAEGILRESQKMQAIGHLTGGIAHDFNNLLTVILGNLEYVRSKVAEDVRLASRVERVTLAAQRGATLTAQMLAFARKQPLAPTAVMLSDTLPDMVQLLRRTLGEGIDVRYVETAGLWPAMADPAQLESAVLNLALNARDAMPSGGRLTIELANKVLDDDYARSHAEVTAGDYAMLAVSDTGHGMSPEVAARVFEPFYTTKEDGKGTGLGLAMVFGFVKQSNGHVKIYSEPGQGTTVRIYLPRALSAPAAVLQRATEPLDLPRGSATVLVVEDEPGVREIAASILADLGYRVLEASDGEEALRVFAAQAADVDLLLTDVVLPGALRGRDVAERITAIRPEVRTLFMSGYTENSIVHNGRLDDGIRFIGKPFKREQLARKVADALAGSVDEAGSASGSNVIDFKAKREG